MWRRFVGVLVGLVCASAATASAATENSGFFKTPSGNIVCSYSYGKSVEQPLLVCGIASGLKPAPPKTGAVCKHLDYVGNRVSLTATGRVHAIACAGDAGPFADPQAAGVLRYGRTWRGGGFVCRSEQNGLTCKNRLGHGFFLSRAHWRPL